MEPSLFNNIAPTQLHVFLCQKFKIAQLRSFQQRNNERLS